jgi:hypothetical protein
MAGLAGPVPEVATNFRMVGKQEVEITSELPVIRPELGTTGISPRAAR